MAPKNVSGIASPAMMASRQVRATSKIRNTNREACPTLLARFKSSSLMVSASLLRTLYSRPKGQTVGSFLISSNPARTSVTT